MENENKEKAKEYYSKIGRIWCPALKDYIIFNSVGFNHLIRKRGVLRAKGEQMRRLNLLVEMVDVISNPEISMHHEQRNTIHSVHRGDEKIMVATPTDFWKLVQQKDGKIIKVVIRQFEGGAKHFLSVYAREQKTAH